ncbi:NADH-quinone oxidoreductase subunit M [Desulfobulbus oralis]|uniref:NADH-quinone oxidoreductase subunit M n=1 Tax=Desulfobulbus oralis TaxID=1986146 RepID=A0A2L1GNQ2_9BACT|nr:NADH-quinone oxidoreductase subunit M [Desulfobulbus oralis]AVD71247.1 NADH-quinone oxidoreductase subunit M [Desulfobulbus oralis]
MPLLSVLIFFPVLGGLSLLFLERKTETVRLVALIVSIFELLFALPIFFLFDKTTPLVQFKEQHAWIDALNIHYFLGIDGISVLFVLLTALLTVLCVMVSWEAIQDRAKEFYIALLTLEGAMMGVFCALDLFLFYVFWEAMLIPMFLIIGIWGGPNRIYATIKFFLYTLAGSLLMLVGIILLYLAGGHSFDVLALAEAGFDFRLQVLVFWLFFAAFAVKVPMWPVHTWLPDAHTEAPAAGSVILAGVLIKMGAYGFLRFSLPLLPQATLAMMGPMLALSVVAIVYGAFVCLAQSDLKRLVAYSSVSHMGFVTLGLFALNQNSLEGSILQMINHGLVTGALFLAIGIVYERTHTREISDYGGLAKTMPIFAAFFMVFTLAAIGLPGTCGFIGEWLILLGAFQAKPLVAILAASGLILGAWYMLWLYQRVFFMEVGEKVKALKQLRLREVLTLSPMVLLIFWIGIYPDVFLDFLRVSVSRLIEQVHSAGGAEIGFNLQTFWP